MAAITSEIYINVDHKHVKIHLGTKKLSNYQELFIISKMKPHYLRVSITLSNTLPNVRGFSKNFVNVFLCILLSYENSSNLNTL